MELRVLNPKEKLLRTSCNIVPKKDLRRTSVQEEIEALIDFVYGNNNKGQNRKRDHATTVGLSANQVGINKRISIVDLAIGKRGYGDIHVLINPEIVWSSKTVATRVEGCVNLPSIWGKVTRSQRVKVKALDRSGNELLLTLNGWPAILLQHEIDHLNGKLFIDKLEDPTKAHLVDKGDYLKYKKQKTAWKKFIDVTDLIQEKK